MIKRSKELQWKRVAIGLTFPLLMAAARKDKGRFLE